MTRIPRFPWFPTARPLFGPDGRRRALSVLLLPIFASSFALALAARQAGAGRDDDKEDESSEMVVRYVRDHKGNVLGNEVMLLVVEPAAGGKRVELWVPNNDTNKRDYDPLTKVANVVDDAKPGDLLLVETVGGNRGKTEVRSVEKYNVVEGEDSPKAFVFVSTTEKTSGKKTQAAVVLKKFGQEATVLVPTVKGEGGEMVSDPKMMELVNGLKEGDVVEADVKGGGRGATLVSLDRYTEPKTGTLGKLTEAEVEGQKAQAVEIDGESVLLPGKLAGKKWVTDTKVLAAVRKIKAGREVEYKTRDDGDKTFLKDIRPAPKKVERDPGEGFGEDRDGDGKKMKKDDDDEKDNGDRGDKKEGRGRRGKERD